MLDDNNTFFINSKVPIFIQFIIQMRKVDKKWRQNERMQEFKGRVKNIGLCKNHATGSL